MALLLHRLRQKRAADAAGGAGAGCGRRISRCSRQGRDFRITWQAPGKEQGGRPLRDLAGFRLQRRDILGDGNDCAACPDSWKLLTAIDLDFPGETQKERLAPSSTYDRELPPGSTSQYQLLALSRSGGSSSPATSPLKKMLPRRRRSGYQGGAAARFDRALTFTFTPPAGGKAAWLQCLPPASVTPNRPSCR